MDVHRLYDHLRHHGVADQLRKPADVLGMPLLPWPDQLFKWRIGERHSKPDGKKIQQTFHEHLPRNV